MNWLLVGLLSQFFWEKVVDFTTWQISCQRGNVREQQSFKLCASLHCDAFCDCSSLSVIFSFLNKPWQLSIYISDVRLISPRTPGWKKKLNSLHKLKKVIKREKQQQRREWKQKAYWTFFCLRVKSHWGTCFSTYKETTWFSRWLSETVLWGNF